MTDLKTLQEEKKKFEKWCQEETATFGSRDEDDYNISFSELSFYDKLLEKYEKSIKEVFKAGELSGIRKAEECWPEKMNEWTGNGSDLLERGEINGHNGCRQQAIINLNKLKGLK